MSGRIVNYVPEMPAWSELLKIWPDVNLSYNLSPGQTIAAFRSPAGKAMRWGLIPHWAKEFSSEFATHNAQIETLKEKPAYRDAWHNNQRCLIPILGYYEWQGERGHKQPYFVYGKDNQGLVAAGLYDQWGSAGNYSCTLITKPASAGLAEIHPRMLALLTPESAKQWMKLEQNQALDYLAGIESPKIEFHRVAKDVGNSLANGKRLIKKLEY